MPEIKIETFTDAAGETRFRVVAQNGQITLTPHEGYTRKEDCLRAIEENFGAVLEAICNEGLLVVGEDGTRHRLRRNAAEPHRIRRTQNPFDLELVVEGE